MLTFYLGIAIMAVSLGAVLWSLIGYGAAADLWPEPVTKDDMGSNTPPD